MACDGGGVYQKLYGYTSNIVCNDSRANNDVYTVNTTERIVLPFKTENIK